MLSSRSTLDSRAGAKTPGRENTTHRAALKGKFKNNDNTVSVPLQSNVDVSKSFASVREVPRPLVDKTPFPNRVALASKFATPLPDKQKLAQLLLEANKTNALFSNSSAAPDSAARASSARAHVRAPRLSANTNFETPLLKGNPWDVSEVEMVLPDTVAEVLESEDYDEIEYMPPKSVEAYTPPFNFPLPDYSTVGKRLLGLAHSYPYDDTAAVEIEPDAQGGPWNMFTLPDILTDDPFIQGKGKLSARPAPARSTGPPSRAAVAGKHTKPIRLGNPVSTANTTMTSGGKAVLPSIRRTATAAAMYSSRTKQPVESVMMNLEFSFDLEEDFLFDV
ncbi:hypothetical protein C8R46DRAFT_1104089 [Mycena filopes]|nr:hypothetical protein C8R46DRAFT_1104089 [Mycena filopes]